MSDLLRAAGTQPGPEPAQPDWPDPTKPAPFGPPSPEAPPEEFPPPEPVRFPIHPDIPAQPIHEPTPERPIA